MPRLNPKVFRQARKLHSLLPYLISATRDLESAQNELRWLSQAFSGNPNGLRQACLKRSKHYPLQYILGSQPFERLDILCQPGVLIPRWETEEWTLKLASLIKLHSSTPLKILDLCTGTGCIPLLLSSSVRDSNIWAIDISPTAISLVNRNVQHNSKVLDLARSNNSISAVQANVLNSSMPTLPVSRVDLITANPPYIPTLFNTASPVERSVRLFEPKLALVGDKEFYAAIFNHAVNLQAQALVCEVGDQTQIDHMFNLARQENSKTSLEDSTWQYGSMCDSSGNSRVVLLWKPRWSFLDQMCSKK